MVPESGFTGPPRGVAETAATVGEPTLRLIPLGGLGEIGLNMMLLERGTTCSPSTAG